MGKKMTQELAQQFIDRRNKHTGETWKQSVAMLAPSLNSLSVKAYVNKLVNGKLSTKRMGRPSVVRSNAITNYNILSEVWVSRSLHSLTTSCASDKETA